MLNLTSDEKTVRDRSLSEPSTYDDEVLLFSALDGSRGQYRHTITTPTTAATTAAAAAAAAESSTTKAPDVNHEQRPSECTWRWRRDR